MNIIKNRNKSIIYNNIIYRNVYYYFSSCYFFNIYQCYKNQIQIQ